MLITHVHVHAIQADAAGFSFYSFLFSVSYWLSSVACTVFLAFKRTGQSQISGKKHLLCSCLFFLIYSDGACFVKISELGCMMLKSIWSFNLIAT